jgi:CheY-like chemotaxis protein
MWEKSVKQILVVEDNPGDSERLVRLLRKNRVTNPIQVLTDGLLALDYLLGVFPYSHRQSFPLPALLFTELNMPGRSGYELLKWFSAHGEVPRPKILIYTQITSWSELKLCRELGADGFLLKQTMEEQISYFLADYPAIWEFVHPVSRTLNWH